jgi:putative transcriptional regulator
MKQQLLQDVSVCLLKEAYTVKYFTGCFDLVARKEGQVLLLKVVEDANSVQEGVIEQLQRIAEGIEGSALLVSVKAGQKLQDQVVYTRHGLSVVTVSTLQSVLKHKYPFVVSKPSGLTAKLLSNQLSEKLEELQLSLGGLSRKLGVSTRMVVKYKEGDAEISLQRALKLYDVLGGEVFAPVNIFTSEGGLFAESTTPVGLKYHELGFNAIDTKKVPFSLIAKKDSEIILTQVGDKVRKDTAALSQLVNAQDLVIFSKKKPRAMPALSREEFLEFEESAELLKFLKEFD